MDKDKRFAVLIDADNISPKYIDIILTETANYGTASIRRIVIRVIIVRNVYGQIFA